MTNDYYKSKLNEYKKKIENLRTEFEKQHELQPWDKVVVVKKGTGTPTGVEGIFKGFNWDNWLINRIEPIVKKIKKDGTASLQGVWVKWDEEIKKA